MAELLANWAIGCRYLSGAYVGTTVKIPEALPLRVQVPNNHILPQNLFYGYYYPNPEYLNILGPLGYPKPSTTNY